MKIPALAFIASCFTIFQRTSNLAVASSYETAADAILKSIPRFSATFNVNNDSISNSFNVVNNSINRTVADKNHSANDITDKAFSVVYQGHSKEIRNVNGTSGNSANQTKNASLAFTEFDKVEETNADSFRGIVQCFKAPYLLQCFNERLYGFVKLWKDNLLRSVRRQSSQNTEIANNSVIRNVVNSLYEGITNFFYSKEATEILNKARQSANFDDMFNDETDVSDVSIPEKERGHHKKKKAQKEIKKFILKVILGIFLFKLKIKMILGMIQSILTSKLIAVASLYVLTLTFKIWWEIKQHKLHNHDKHIVYYDNAHHDHTYDLPEHAEYDESYGSSLHHGGDSSGAGHGGGWGWGNLWGRSFPVKSAPTNGKAPFRQPVINNHSPDNSRPKTPIAYYPNQNNADSFTHANEEEEFT